MILKNPRNYRSLLRQTPRAARQATGSVRLALDYFTWSATLAPGRSPLNDRRPWITFGATHFLERYLQPNMRVFEWGSGGSTLFFASRVNEVFSAEHDAPWHEKVAAALVSAGIANCEAVLLPPELLNTGNQRDPSDPQAYGSSDPAFGSHSFERYVRTIDQFENESFDLILIDGRSRPSCFLHAISKVKPGGLIVLDNSDRDTYAPAIRLAPGSWTHLDFPGPCPYLRHLTRTSIWKAGRQ